MEGNVIRHKTLIRLILTHCEIDLMDIENAYRSMLGSTVQERIAVSYTLLSFHIY